MLGRFVEAITVPPAPDGDVLGAGRLRRALPDGWRYMTPGWSSVAKPVNRRQITRRTVSKNHQVLCGILVKRLVIQPVNEFTDAAAAVMSGAFDRGACGLANLLANKAEASQGCPGMARSMAARSYPAGAGRRSRRNGVRRGDRARGAIRPEPSPGATCLRYARCSASMPAAVWVTS